MIRPLKSVPGIGKQVLGIPRLDGNILHPRDDLVMVLDPQIGPNRSSLVSQLYFEADFIPRVDRIRIHIQILHDKGPDPRFRHGPSPLGFPSAEGLGGIHRPAGAIEIHLNEEAMLAPAESIPRPGELDPILARSDHDIMGLDHDFISVLDGKGRSSALRGLVENCQAKAHPPPFPDRVWGYVKIKNPQV